MAGHARAHPLPGSLWGPPPVLLPAPPDSWQVPDFERREEGFLGLVHEREQASAPASSLFPALAVKQGPVGEQKPGEGEGGEGGGEGEEKSQGPRGLARQFPSTGKRKVKPDCKRLRKGKCTGFPRLLQQSIPNWGASHPQHCLPVLEARSQRSRCRQVGSPRGCRAESAPDCPVGSSPRVFTSFCSVHDCRCDPISPFVKTQS